MPENLCDLCKRTAVTTWQIWDRSQRRYRDLCEECLEKIEGKFLGS